MVVARDWSAHVQVVTILMGPDTYVPLTYKDKLFEI